MLPVANNPENESLGSREVPFGRELYIEREDFMEEPPRKYFRMFPGNETLPYKLEPLICLSPRKSRFQIALPHRQGIRI